LHKIFIRKYSKYWKYFLFFCGSFGFG